MDSTTFKDFQMDERYKRLERTLKMVLLKNAENRSSDSPMTGSWPSISSIHGENLDTSCAGMSTRSSRIGSEVVASSSNLRSMMYQRSSFQPENAIGTSSDKQFPTKRDVDSLMMPPPRTPAASHARKFSSESRDSAPLATSSIKKMNFAQSTPSASSCNSPVVRKLSQIKQYSEKIYKEPEQMIEHSGITERIFSRWRVLLNDKAQLIIKGTLECGKVARSKPVIRRLAATTVQSVFKHTYHLRGNLVDERNELPEYVSGKFYNGFPDDWENVYQVWRNFVSDGSRLSFRWPTPITDSDDDIKSEITDITYPEIQGKARSPRQGARGSKTLSPLSTTNSEENKSQCSCSHVNSPRKNISDRSKSVCKNDSAVAGSVAEKNITMHDTSVSSLNSDQRAIGTSLKDIILEDKLNIIIENLTSKNCSLDYIKKIVEMFDCMKYVMSYQTTELSETQSVDVSTNTESNERNDREEKMNEGVNTLASSVEKPAKDRNNILNDGKPKYHRGQSEIRRELMLKDYSSSDSENDGNVRKSMDLRSRHKLSKSRRFREHKMSNVTKRSKHQQQDTKGIDELSRHIKRKSSLSSDDECQYSNPRKSSLAGKTPRGVIDPHDSSISLTEDEGGMNFGEGSRIKGGIMRGRGSYDLRATSMKNEMCDPGKKESKKERYDSSVSITEDEREICVSKNINARPKIEDNQVNKNRQSDSSRQEDSAYMSDLKHRTLNKIRNVGQDETAKTYTVETQLDALYPKNVEKRFLTPAKTIHFSDKRNLPLITGNEIVNINLRNFAKLTRARDENDMNAPNTSRSEEIFKERQIVKELPPSDSEAGEERFRDEITKKESRGAVHANRSVLREKNLESVESSSVAEIPTAKFGSELNPKKLTGWVPAVICEDDHKCGLVFEGKLLNEAGHVVNRKFTTDFVKRRIKAKFIETLDGVYYQLVGDLHDTKQAVPKDLLKQCRNGCPTKIHQFYDKWKALSEKNEPPVKESGPNTSVDCLSVPTSSRGRRILPPLNYWIGERITTKDNKAIYSPGNSKDFSLTSSFEKTQEEKGSNTAKMQDPEKVSTTGTRSKSARHRHAAKKNESSSDSGKDDKRTRNVIRKRKARPNDPTSSAPTTSRTRTQNGKNTSQSLERSSSSRQSSFEKTGEEGPRIKLRKRQKTNQEEVAIAGPVKQLTMKGTSGVTCTLYKNVPLHDCDLSEDQLSTI